MRHAGVECGRTERWISFTILSVLVAVAAGVFLQQFTFNPAVLVARDIAPKSVLAGASSDAAPAWLPPELKPFGAPESFTPDNLYDKIDGKAELYVAAGFVEMHCQRFALKEAPDDWLEWFVYNMGSQPQAFSVFSTQRRSEGETLKITPYAYKTRNALFFVCGSNYVEAVASSDREPLTAALRSMAERFVAADPSAAARVPELDILPTEGLLAGTGAMQSSDAFGFDQFKKVFTAQYRLDGGEATAFVTSCPSAEAAAALRDGYRLFLLANGGKDLEASARSGPRRAIEIMGTFEIIFSHDTFVAGVHAAPSLAAADELAVRLQARLTSRSK